ncbi:hypothetical protein C8R43DRAFT_1143117 [Mycena crocata]|nr:hypothetical protein C8R43DRAFT_1143117 [Mycena crocata]
MKSLLLTSVSSYARKCWRLRELDAEVATLETSIAEHTAAIARSTSLMEAKLDHLRELRSILSPLLSLPNELLREIFGFHFDLAARGIDAAHCVAQVCGRWREAALATPRIWENLGIPGYGWVRKDAPPSTDDDFQLRVAAAPSHRGPSTLIAITLSMEAGSRYAPPTASLSVVPEIWRAAGRIASLELNIHDAVLPFAALPPDSTLPVLRWASLCVLDSPSGDCTLGPALAWFASSPCLERLSLHFPFKVPLLSSSALPWATLRNLDLNFPIPCCISGLLPTEEGRTAAFTLPDLLRLYVDIAEPYENVFHLLTCPALTRLTLCPETLDVQVLLNFQARSKFNLTTLDLSLPTPSGVGHPPFSPSAWTWKTSDQVADTGGLLKLEVLHFLSREGPPAILPSLHTLHLLVKGYNRECLCETYRSLTRPCPAPGPFPPLRLVDRPRQFGAASPSCEAPAELRRCQIWLADGRRFCLTCTQFTPAPVTRRFAAMCCGHRLDIVHNGAVT